MCGANSEDAKASLFGAKCEFETLGSTPRWSSGLRSQGILGHFQTERWSARRLSWICKKVEEGGVREGRSRHGQGYFTEGKGLCLFYRKVEFLWGLMSRS